MKQNMRCLGNAPMGGCVTMPPMGQYETCQQVVEPTIACTPQQHHYHRVDHVIPVVVRNVHHHHNHHNYVINRQESVESYYYDEYLAGQPPMNLTQGMQSNSFDWGQPLPQMTSNPQPTTVSQSVYTQQMMAQPTVTQQPQLNNLSLVNNAGYYNPLM